MRRRPSSGCLPMLYLLYTTVVGAVPPVLTGWGRLLLSRPVPVTREGSFYPSNPMGHRGPKQESGPVLGYFYIDPPAPRRRILSTSPRGSVFLPGNGAHGTRRSG